MLSLNVTYIKNLMHQDVTTQLFSCFNTHCSLQVHVQARTSAWLVDKSSQVLQSSHLIAIYFRLEFDSPSHLIWSSEYFLPLNCYYNLGAMITTAYFSTSFLHEQKSFNWNVAWCFFRKIVILHMGQECTDLFPFTM